MVLTGFVHLTGLGRVHGHAGFGHDVFACGECRQCDRAMQIGPSTDHDGVDLSVGDQLFPTFVRLGDAEFLGSRRRSTPAVDSQPL